MSNCHFWSANYFIDGNEAWFIDYTTNDLYKWELDTGKVIFITQFPIERQQFKSHPFCVKWENDIIAFPDFGDNVWIYRVTENDFSKISVGKKELNRYGCINPIIDGDDIWMIACESGCILHVNVRRHKYEWSNKIAENKICLESAYKNKHIYFASAETNILYVYNTEKKEYKSYRLKGCEYGFHTLCNVEDEIWLSDSIGRIICWNINAQKISNIIFLPDDFRQSYTFGNNIFLQSRYVDGKVCFIPAYYNPLQTNKIVIINPSDYKSSILPIIDQKDIKDNFIFVEFERDNGQIGVWTLKDESILILDIKNNCISKKQQFLSETEQKFMRIRNHFVETETETYDLSQFLCDINARKFPDRNIEKIKNTIGEEIYKAV